MEADRFRYLPRYDVHKKDWVVTDPQHSSPALDTTVRYALALKVGNEDLQKELHGVHKVVRRYQKEIDKEGSAGAASTLQEARWGLWHASGWLLDLRCPVVIKIVSRAVWVESFACVMNFDVFDGLFLWSCLSWTFPLNAENSWAYPWFS
jgi:hypothetical protein